MFLPLSVYSPLSLLTQSWSHYLLSVTKTSVISTRTSTSPVPQSSMKFSEAYSWGRKYELNSSCRKKEGPGHGSTVADLPGLSGHQHGLKLGDERLMFCRTFCLFLASQGSCVLIEQMNVKSLPSDENGSEPMSLRRA